jgi:hypothetical protein
VSVVGLVENVLGKIGGVFRGIRAALVAVSEETTHNSFESSRPLVLLRDQPEEVIKHQHGGDRSDLLAALRCLLSSTGSAESSQC